MSEVGGFEEAQKVQPGVVETGAEQVGGPPLVPGQKGASGVETTEKATEVAEKSVTPADKPELPPGDHATARAFLGQALVQFNQTLEKIAEGLGKSTSEMLRELKEDQEKRAEMRAANPQLEALFNGVVTQALAGADATTAYQIVSSLKDDATVNPEVNRMFRDSVMAAYNQMAISVSENQKATTLQPS